MVRGEAIDDLPPSTVHNLARNLTLQIEVLGSIAWRGSAQHLNVKPGQMNFAAGKFFC